jgi:hypothetical protein
MFTMSDVADRLLTGFRAYNNAHLDYWQVSIPKMFTAQGKQTVFLARIIKPSGEEEYGVGMDLGESSEQWPVVREGRRFIISPD